MEQIFYFFASFIAIILDVVSIAMTQYGYHEGNSEADMGGTNRDGYKNFAEYNRMYGKLDNGEGNGMSYGYSWCAAFVSWCLRQSRVEETAAITEVSCRRMTDWYREQGRFYSRQSGYTPLPGDIIMFHDGDGVPSHVGFVLGVAVPREPRYSAKEYTTLLADTSYTIGRSLAAGDVNFALLVK